MFVKQRAFVDAQTWVACGRCTGCRLEQAQQWATRIYHETLCHEDNSFVTLTYSDDNYPVSGSLDGEAMTNFMKRLRFRVGDVRIRFFGVGEYGEKNGRAHYHYLLFGYQFPDLQLWRRSRSGFYLYRSPLLESVWPFGHCEVGMVSLSSGAYVARYCLKKINGSLAAEYYTRTHPVTGEIVTVCPEISRMSRMPGIGADWYAVMKDDAFPSDYVIVDGRRRKVPDFYLKKFRDEDAVRWEFLRLMRLRKMSQNRADRSPERLAVREEVAVRRVLELPRELEV